MKVAIIVFPGSNCDTDMYHAFSDILDLDVDYVFHKETNLELYDIIVLPGGFSYGDYLRPGALAKHSPIMDAIKTSAEAGKIILGVCNGFQILTECGLLPGALLHNKTTKFICKNQILKVKNNKTIFTNLFFKDELVNIPIAHADGRYYCDTKTLQSLRQNNQILFKYISNPNGSIDGIAGIINERGNVLGMMPHPERAVELLLNSVDGLILLESMTKNEFLRRRL